MMFRVFLIIGVFTLYPSLGHACNSGNLVEDTSCRREMLKETEEIFRRHSIWIIKVDNMVQKLITEKAACVKYKQLYKSSGYDSIYKKKIEMCDGPRTTDWLKRFTALSADYKLLKGAHGKMMEAYTANKLEIDLLKQEYALLSKDRDSLQRSLNINSN